MNQKSDFERILVPIDFSPHSNAALELAVRLGQPFNSEIHLLVAYFHFNPQHPTGELLIPNDFWGTDEEGARKRLASLFVKVEEAGLPGDIHLTNGRPELVILDQAKALPANLIVMGTRGRTGLSHVVVGSVAERVVRLSPCPVMTVRAPQEDEAWEHMPLEMRQFAHEDRNE